LSIVVRWVGIKRKGFGKNRITAKQNKGDCQDKAKINTSTTTKKIAIDKERNMKRKN